MTDVFGQALKHFLEKGDMDSIRKLTREYALLEYNRKHDVRMSGAHMAPGCLGKECPPFEWQDN
jgi:hypothetical protein